MSRLILACIILAFALLVAVNVQASIFLARDIARDRELRSLAARVARLERERAGLRLYLEP